MLEFQKKVEGLLLEAEQKELIEYLAIHPKSGNVIPGTGGLGKLRWAAKGKRSGARVIYYFHNESIPLFLLSIFGKNEKNDLTGNEKKQLSKLVDQLVQNYKGVS